MNPGFLDIIRALLDANARFIIVGAYAVNIYVDPRATGDLDIWVEPAPENAQSFGMMQQDGNRLASLFGGAVNVGGFALKLRRVSVAEARPGRHQTIEVASVFPVKLVYGPGRE